MADPKILLLAGTAEARQLAFVLDAHGYGVEASLAGLTSDPKSYPVPTRRGGFGGVDGLCTYLQTQNISAIINATHPFAAGITANAEAAATRTNIPCLHLRRPEWSPQEGDNWTRVPTLEAAAANLPPGAVAFLATGSGSTQTFATRRDIRTILRVIEMPDSPQSPNETRIVARPPFSLEHEMKTLRADGITHLVCKNSGGKEGQTKLTAARELGLPVIMVDRPAMPIGANTVQTLDVVLDWLAQRA